MFTIRSREKMSSVGRGFSLILALHRFQKWCREGFLRAGLEHLRVRQPPPWHGQHCFKKSSVDRCPEGEGKVLLGWARTTVSVTYGVGTHPRGG